MSNTFFSADHHFGHANVIKHAHRPFASVEEMTEVMIERWNEVVKRGDLVYYLGDFALIGGNTISFDEATRILSRLHGQKFLLLGNHDPEHLWKHWTGGGNKWVTVGNVRPVKVNNQKIWLSHYAHRIWPSSHHGAWHLYGHCFDEETEVLTLEGWRGFESISLDSQVATIAYPSRMVRYQLPLEVIHFDWTGDEYRLFGRNVDGVFTPNHTIIIENTGNKNLEKIEAASFSARANRKIPLCGVSGFPDFPITDDMLRLYVWMVTDGTIENTTLGRFHFRKERKILCSTKLLDRMRIPFTQNLRTDGTTGINFRIPSYLLTFSIKPLDGFIRFLSQKQAAIFVEEYCQTDGNHQGPKAFQISTGKSSEADLLQHFLVTHGFSCNLSLRTRDLTNHGYGIYDVWVLSCNSKAVWHTTTSHKAMTVESVVEKPFWCLRIPNQTLIIRRNGKVHITGNSHGTAYDDPHSLSMDVGVDTHSFYPYSFEEIETAMSKKTHQAIDHHG